MTTLLMITRDPFANWKCAAGVLREARLRGFTVFVALDDQTELEDARRIGQLADVVRPFTSDGHCENAYALVPEVEDEWVFLVSDDEEPSRLAWALASEPPFRARFGIPVIPVKGQQLWRPDVGIQERLFPVDGWRWTGGFEGTSDSSHKAVAIGTNPGVIIWHRYLDAPRAFREAKAATYERLSPDGGHRQRLIWEEHPEGFVDLPPFMAVHLPEHRRLN